nr:hypothetical protein [Tanacetum cinerariifolium]
MDSEQSSLGPALHEMTPATISSGLVPKPTSSTSVDHLTPKVIAPIAEVVAPEPAESTGSPSSKTVDHDAPSPSKSQTTLKTQPLIIPNDVEEDNHDIEVAHIALELMLLKTSRKYAKGLLLLVEELNAAGISAARVILKTASYSYYCQYKVSVVQIVSAASIVVNTVSSKVVDGVVKLVAPTTAKQRLAKKNELKARGTLLMALPDKHQLKFYI